MKEKKQNKIKSLEIWNERLWLYVKNSLTITNKYLRNKDAIRKDIKGLLENYRLSGVTVFSKKSESEIDGYTDMVYEYSKLESRDISDLIEHIINILIDNAIIEDNKTNR